MNFYVVNTYHTSSLVTDNDRNCLEFQPIVIVKLQKASNLNLKFQTPSTRFFLWAYPTFRAHGALFLYRKFSIDVEH